MNDALLWFAVALLAYAVWRRRGPAGPPGPDGLPGPPGPPGRG